MDSLQQNETREPNYLFVKNIDSVVDMVPVHPYDTIHAQSSNTNKQRTMSQLFRGMTRFVECDFSIEWVQVARRTSRQDGKTQKNKQKKINQRMTPADHHPSGIHQCFFRLLSWSPIGCMSSLRFARCTVVVISVRPSLSRMTSALQNIEQISR